MEVAMRRLAPAVTLLASIVVFPSLVYAQASITGIVKDTSGAVLPGVTVEAASPALIEKTRSVVSDGTGQYRIENLRPGTYVVTFTLAGFNVVKREGIELAGSFTATVNTELRVGALEETITVTGETPTVDVQNTTRQQVIDHTIIDAFPTGKSEKALALLVPEIVSSAGQDAGGALTNVQGGMTAHGSKGTEARIMQNGISKAAGFGGGNNSNVLSNMLAYQEVTFDSAAVSAEMATGGVRVNFIPKDGGNTFNATLVGSFANHGMQRDNYTQALKDAGLRAPNTLNRMWDVNPGLGGPVKKDRLWFYATVRYFVTGIYPPGIRFNLNANNPNVWAFAPDPSRQPFNDSRFKDGNLRLTWQATSKNKFGFSWTQQMTCYCLEAINATVAPEGAIRRLFPADRDLLFDWSSPVSNRLLLDAAGINRREPTTRRISQFTSPAMISVTDQALGNLVYRAPAGLFRDTTYHSLSFRAAASYITGAHAFKVGFTFGRASDPTTTFPPTQPYNFRFNNGVPNQITLFATPTSVEWQADVESGVYAQDKWTIGRLALGYGVRYDFYKSSYPAQTLGPGPLVPTRNLTLPEAPGVSWHDLTPKSGAVYDLFGNGKTALKVTLNKYLQGVGNGGDFGLALAPVNRLVTTTTRAWNDANRDFVPDCDLTNPALNGECGAFANQNFGKTIPGATYDPDTLSGWGKRGFDWEFSTGVQQELLPRVALSVYYFRRWYGNFIVTDDRAVVASEYTPFSLTAPGTDARLPNAGTIVTGLYDLNPTAFGRALDNYLTFSKNYGKQIEHWNGFDVTMNARPRAGVLLQGGLSTGRTSTDNCEVAVQVPESLRVGGVWTPLEYCHQDTKFVTQVKALGSYTVPRVGVQISGTLISLPGPLILANYNAPNAVVAPSLGRSLSGNAANITVGLQSPGTMYGERLNQVDLRVAKILRVGRSRTSLNLDFLNLFNSNSILAVNNTFGGATPWLTPQSILLAGYVKIGAQVDF
jgi:hypothetical protein